MPHFYQIQDEESPDIEFQYDDADTHAAEIAEAYRLSSDDVLMILLPKIERQFNSPRGKDPRIGVTLTAKEIKTYGELVYESN